MSYQQDIFSKLSALKSTNSIPPLDTDSIRANQQGDFIDFLVSLIKQVSGQDKFKNIVFKSVLGELNKPTTLNTLIRNIFKKNYFCELNFIIPQKYTTESINGIQIPINDINLFGVLSVDPDSKLGQNVYEGNDINKHMNYMIYQSQQVGETNPISFTGVNGVLFELYAKDSQTLVFKFGSFYKNKSFAIWAEDFFESTEFFNSSNFMMNLSTSLFGSGFLLNETSLPEIESIENLTAAFSKLFGFCGGSNNYNYNPTNINTEVPVIDSSGNNFLRNNQTTLSDLSVNIFEFDDSELTSIQEFINNKSKGVYNFQTCGNTDIFFNPQLVVDNLNNIFTDRYLDDLGKYDNEVVNINLDHATNFFDDILKDGVKLAIDSGRNQVSVNFNNMLDELQVSIIKAIPNVLLTTVLSPKTMLFLYVSNKITASQNTPPINYQDVIGSIKGVLSTIGISMSSRIISNMTQYSLKEIGKLAKTLSIEFLKQRALDYASILRIIADLFSNFNNNDINSCGGAISLIFRLLDGNIRTPAGTIPHIVIPFLNQVKPGLNHVAVINDLKANLAKKGIETAPFYADGTPNYQMYMMEEVVKVMVEHIKLKSKIDVGGFAGPFPIVGGAQII